MHRPKSKYLFLIPILHHNKGWYGLTDPVMHFYKDKYDEYFNYSKLNNHHTLVSCGYISRYVFVETVAALVLVWTIFYSCVLLCVEINKFCFIQQIKLLAPLFACC